MKEITFEIEQYDERTFIVSDAVAGEIRQTAMYNSSQGYIQLSDKYDETVLINLNRVSIITIEEAR